MGTRAGTPHPGGSVAGARPSAGELYVPWAEKIGKQRSMQFMQGSSARAAALSPAPPGSRNMNLVGNSDKDGTINSDLATRRARPTRGRPTGTTGASTGNGGLNGRGPTGNRGFDAFELTGSLASVTNRAKTWRYSNPQTQEARQAP